MSNNTVTLKTIANKLGISTNAVSKALRNCDDISEQTKLKVREVAKELGYVPNSMASNMRKKDTKIIALVYNDFYNPYFSIFCEKTFHNLKSKGYQCQLIYSDTSIMTMHDIENILINNFSAVISFVEPTLEISELFKKRGIPFVLIGINSKTPYIDCIYTDDILGGKLVGEYFVSSSYQKSLYITNSVSETSYRRYLGFSTAINGSNKNCEFIPYQEHENILKIALHKVIKDGFDFVFCFSDSLAIQFKNYLKQNGYRNSVKIFGYDNLNKYYPLIQKISTIDSDMLEIIEFSCNYVIDKASGKIDKNTYISKMFPTYLSVFK